MKPTLVRLGAPVLYQFRIHWRGTLVLAGLGALTLGLLLPGRALSRPGPGGAPALALPEIPPAGPALSWTVTAQAPSETQALSLGELLSLLTGLAWIGFGVAAVSILAVTAASARERAREAGIRRAAGASHRSVLASVLLETLVLAILGWIGGLAIGGALLSIARSMWPGAAAAVPTADPGAALALAGVLGAALLSTLSLVRPEDLLHPPSEEVGLGVPTCQVGISIALLLGAASLLGARTATTSTARTAETASLYRVEHPADSAGVRGGRYAALLETLARTPGITRASLTSAGTPLGLGTTGEVTTDCGLCYFGLILIKWPSLTALVHAVSTDTFSAQSIEILEGRGFSAADRAGAARVAIVNRHLARRYFQGGHAVGRDIFLATGWPKTPYRVIGVVDDERSPAIGGSIQPRETVYLSVLQHPPERPDLLLEGPAGGQAGALAMPVAIRRIGTLADYRRPQQRATQWMGGALAATALGLLGIAFIGTFATARRWADSLAWELALRRAVGARRRRIAWYIFRRTASIGVLGAVGGLFLYAVVVAPALAGARPVLPLSRPGLLITVIFLPALLALGAGAVPGLRLLGRAPSYVLR